MKYRILRKHVMLLLRSSQADFVERWLISMTTTETKEETLGP